MEDSKLRKIIREALEEELGKETRYVATMEFYVWAQSDSEALAQAKAQATDLEMKHDNHWTGQTASRNHGKFSS
jgi:hypothetical protein